MTTAVEIIGEQEAPHAGHGAVLDWVATSLVLVALALAFVIFAVLPFHARVWSRLPFPGGFVEHTMVFNGVGAADWELIREGVSFGDQLVQLNGVPVSSARSLGVLLEGHAVDERVTITLRNAATGQVRDQQVTLQPFQARDFLRYFVTPYLIGLVYLVIGVWVFWLRRHEAAGRAFALFCTSVALGVGTLFDLYTTHYFTRLWTAAIPLAGGALFTLSMVFPQEMDLVRRRPILRWLGFLPVIYLATVAQSTLFDLARPVDYAHAWRNEYLFTGLGFLFYVGLVIYRRYTSLSPIVREQTRIVLLGTVLAFSPVASWFIYIAIRPGLPFNFILLPSLVFFPLAVGYAILRYRLLDTDYIISQGLVYGFLGLLSGASYALLVAGVSLLLGQAIPADNPILLGVLVFALAVLFNPVRTHLQKLVDQMFFRGSRAYRQQLQAFGRALTQAVDLGRVTSLLRQEIESFLQPEHLHIFLYDSTNRTYRAYPGPDGPTTDLRFAASGSLARTLASERVALYLTPGTPLPPALQREKSRMAVLRSQVYVALPGKTALSGWLALGHKLSGEPYVREDLSFLESLADQAALAVERAQVISDLERRVGELNVLSRMAQAVNFTIGYDDLLEMVYAQSSKLMDTSNFRIVLRNDVTGELYDAFYIKDGERLAERENQPWPPGCGLVPEILRVGQPIRTDSYTQECRRRGVKPLNDRYRAWLGVPLNAGDSTLGAMILAYSDPASSVTDEQLAILGAIADQTAGAIVKARLYQETDERARQLTTLNEIAQDLSSTLELDPLLDRIVTSATAILNAEAGSLLLADRETGDLVFRVTVGAVARDLIGTRLRPGVGFVGEAVASGEPLIVNDVQNDPRWFGGSDEQTGFVTRSLMVVPLTVKDRTIGVIEVINKRGGTDFTEHDQSLVTAFASQAAVAIENARLYTLTDQELAARVDELTAMQRIAQELNVSLDVNRTMDITLDWAMRTTGAQAGAVGRAVEEGLLLIASRGCDEAVERYREEPIPPESGAFSQVIQSGEPSLLDELFPEEEHAVLLPTARSRLIMPIRRENKAIGAIILESDEPHSFTRDHLNFIARLSDHAAIAITNASLYAEVKAANIAKSDFVSFVSHELKTPMTSIKGYADLLAQGAVGPVSEMQANFLDTIRTNVERMATLVSDLADISRIEAGRLRLEYASIPFKAVVSDVVTSAKSQIEGKRQTLIVEVPSDLPPIWADQVRQVQILTNLVNNAHKYTPEGGTITLRVTEEQNRRDPEGAPRVLHIQVQDSGIGISPEDQAYIFQKFFRSEDRAARAAPGTGLGLNITKNLTELQGGQIWFESEYGKGSTFHYTVPVAEEFAEITT